MPFLDEVGLQTFWDNCKAWFAHNLSVQPQSTKVTVTLKAADSEQTALATGDIPAATSTTAGVMTAEDKAKLAGIASGATDNIGTITEISTSEPLYGSGTSGAVNISHSNSGVAANTYGKTATTELVPGFGEKIDIPGFTVNATGHITAAGNHKVVIPSDFATDTTPGLMSEIDKSKLDGIAEGATANLGTITEVNTASPITGGGSSGSVTISHGAIGTAGTYGTTDSIALTPGFGQTFEVPGITTNATGHVSEAGSHTVKIPNSIATASSAGLMSTAQFTKLSNIADNATANEGTITGITTTSPLEGSGSEGSVNISHAASGVTSGTYGTVATTALTPDFGDTFAVPGYTVSAEGHVTQSGEHTVKIPNSTATSSTAGLMSAIDKSKLDGYPTKGTDTSKYLRSDGTWQTPPNTSYVSGTGIGISNGVISNTGVVSVDTGTANGTVSVKVGSAAASDVAIKGLKSAAYTESTAYATAAQGILAANAIPSSQKGAASGVAELDSTGKVPASQLPAYVDDVLEYETIDDFPTTGESGKIYVAADTNLTYRWSGTQYVEISSSLALGETSTTAYRGDRGKAAYDHATDSSRLTTAKASGLYKIASTDEGHIASLTDVTKSDITSLGIPASNTTYTVTPGTAASLTTTTYSVPNVTGAGTAPSLTTTSFTVPNVTDAGSAPSLTTTTHTVPNVTSVGTAPSLTVTSTSVVNSVSGGTATVSNGTISFTDVSKGTTNVGSASGWNAGTTPTLGTAFSIKGVNAWSAGSAPTLGTAFTIKGVNTWSAGSIPTFGTTFSIKGVNAWTTNTPTAVVAD